MKSVLTLAVALFLWGPTDIAPTGPARLDFGQIALSRDRVGAASVAVTGGQRTSSDFDLAKLVGICASISSQRQDRSRPDAYSFAFERKIYDAARVNFEMDTPQAARLKIKALWHEHPENMRCESDNFDVSQGHILKYAVATGTFALLDDASRTWGVDLNIIDPSDNKTLLDYIQDQKQRYKGSVVEITLSNYYEIMRRAGAKHRSELR